jgi:VIT1/CCC1 family predicted Fe2+/Mn2+ transporter
LASFLFSKYLSFADRTGEVAFAVIMVITINSYVALSNLNTGFVYIVAVNLGACLTWGIIDGLIYAISSSIERNNMRNRLLTLKSYVKGPNVLDAVKASLDDTFLASFSVEGKMAIAKDIVAYVPDASLEKSRVLTKQELMGWLSIVGIYLAVGFLLALPFLVLPNKVLAWFVSNGFGVAWLFGYGVQLGRSAGKNRWVLGLIMAVVAVVFLSLSYFVWAK